MLIIDVRHDWPKKSGYIVDRPHGRNYYIFAHYYAQVTIKCGGQSYSVPPGACIMLKPNLPHWLYCSEDLIHNWIHLDASAEELIQRYQIPLNRPFFPHNSDTLSNMFRKMEAEFYSDNPFKEELLDGYAREFLIWLHRSLQDLPINHSISAATISKMIAARKTILSSSERSWTLAEMAALVPFSPSRFHAVYKTIFGTTPTQDLIEIRITNAKSLLCSGKDMTLAKIAEILGYNDQYHFIRQFKSVTGLTPGKYRKNK